MCIRDSLEARHRWRGREGVVTPRRVKLSRRPPHDSVARSAVCRCGRLRRCVAGGGRVAAVR
eukprot:5368452-Prymnesium_polylepis.1